MHIFMNSLSLTKKRSIDTAKGNTQMALDIRGSLKNTKLSKNPYVVFEELISNAIDAFLIRKKDGSSPLDMQITLTVDLYNDSFLDDGKSLTAAITCQDNGCGLGQNQLDAFLTKDTSYKDDLNIPGIGQCKGAGRIQFFHHFSKISIQSTYEESDKKYRIDMGYTHPQKMITKECFKKGHARDSDLIGTTIYLDKLNDDARNNLYIGSSLKKKFSAQELKNAILVSQLQRIISLQEQIGDFSISVVCNNEADNKTEYETIKPKDLPRLTAKESVSVQECDPQTGAPLESYQQFDISHYRVDANMYRLPKNIISFCAKSSPVEDITKHYLRTAHDQNAAQNGFYHIVFIESPYLDEHVNEQRDGFIDIPKDIPSSDMFINEKISYTAIYNQIDDIIFQKVSPTQWNKDNVIEELNQSFSISQNMIDDANVQIRVGDTPSTLARRVLNKYQQRNIQETEEMISLSEEMKNLSPDDECFREKLNQFSWKYTSSLKNLNVVSLSQLVVWRSFIVGHLRKICVGDVNYQEHKKRKNTEALIHNILFPMKTDSYKTKVHDIWILGEDYQYYDYITSDLPLSQINLPEIGTLFNKEIDQDERLFLKDRNEANRSIRPDIAIFSKEGSAVIIELKAPGVPLENHLQQLYRYASALSLHSNRRIKKFYVYLIGDTIKEEAINPDIYTSFPTGEGYFRSSPLLDPKTRENVGSLYQEILFYDDVLDKAEKRIKIYRDKLGLSFPSASRPSDNSTN